MNTCVYCQMIGMGDNGTRCGCTMRNEGDVDRPVCEAYAAGGAAVWQTDPPGQEVILHDGNPWQAGCIGCQKMRVCVADLSVCSPWTDMP